MDRIVKNPSDFKEDVGNDNTLYYPSDNKTIGSFRAYFILNVITAGDPSAPSD